MILRTLSFLAVVLIGGSAVASEAKPQHGGRVVDAGDYHVEMVARDGIIDVYVSDHSNKAIPARGYKGVAIVNVDGKSQRIVLEAADDNRISGKAGGALPAQPKGVVQITPPGGKTFQAKYN